MPRSGKATSASRSIESVTLARREDLAIRLFLFPHAGGDYHPFADWPAGLSEEVEVISYSLPGRGRDQDTPPYERWEDLVAGLADLVLHHWDGTPFAFFGHSFGALVAFEVCRHLTEQHRPTPEALFVSAHRAPHLAGGERTGHTLPEPEFRDLVRLWGLVPEEVLADEDLLRIVLPPLRADLKLDETYVCRTGRTGRVLSVPCVVYGGADDPTVGPAELRAWREHFAADVPVDVEILPGGHFYPVSARTALLDSIGRYLDRVKTRVGPSIAVPAAPYPEPDRSIWERFQEQVARVPDAPALVDHPRSWTYRELAGSATALGSELAARGVGKGDVVGLLFPRSAEYCVSLLTCLGTGSPACLLEKNWPPSLLRDFLVDAGVKIVLTTGELAGLLPPEFRAPDRHLVLTADRRTDLAPAEFPTVVEFPTVAADDIALISMTSGTSGTPKAVLNTHRGCLYCFDARFARHPYQESSRDGLNAFFAWECVRPLLKGRPAVVIPDDHIFDPVRLVDTIEEFRITRIVVPPSLFESVLDHPAVGATLVDRLAHMEVWFLMGEVVPTRIVTKAAALLPPHVRLVNSYSTWECLDISFADLLPARPAANSVTDPIASPFARVGRVLDGSAAVLLNAAGEPVPRGGVGELYFAGPGVAQGYLNDPEKTAERFVPCPDALGDTGFGKTGFAGATFYRTGDRARFLPDGELEILGRTGDVVKVRGFKVSLRAVEHVLADQPGVARVVVRPILDGRTNQPVGLTAYLLGEQGRPSETVLARSRLKAKRDLPEYARPRHFIGLDSLPISKNDSRKLDLAALPPPPEVDEDGSVDALTTMEQRMARAWQQVLGGRRIEPDDNFFDLGGNSLSAARLSGVLAERFGIALAVVDVFQYSTLRAMAAHCSSGAAADDTVPARRPRRAEPTRLAVVGMAGRFPGAPTIDDFWENLKNGTDSLTVYSAERLRAKGVPEDIVGHPEWVPVGQIVADADKFDAQFWGIGRREAVIMDPQHRVFVETAWSALEQAGYARQDNPYRRHTGVFAACGIDGYLIHHLAGGGLKEPLDPAGVFLTEIGNEKDYLATRVAYLLDLGGPAMTVTSACSSALVAVAQAAQAIMSGQCDMAIAGGSALTFPNFGYRYADGLVGSADGHVRPFDDDASGTLFGDSVGAVVLKRLDDALADGDHIWAVLAGWGVSNDGRMKAGYAAPSARAQTQCISDAIEMAGVGAEQISYVECHATATHVGDAIELKGLLDAFTAHRTGAGFATGSCAIGSVKGNIGHANCAAGITGFIKTVLCLYHRMLTPTVNYRTLNPKLVDFVDTEGSPFTVQQACRDWTVADPRTQLPRWAGVSSFGIGGTNAHVILAEPPERAPDEPVSRSLYLVTVSARGEGAYRRNATALADFLDGLPEREMAPAIHSAHLRRAAHPLRGSAVVAPDSPDELHALATRPPHAALSPGHVATVAFCFAGQGSQAAGMARGLYRGRADGGRFRRHFDAVCASLAAHLPAEPAALILDADDESVRRPVVTQCGLFAVEYALATTLADLGVRPVAVAGHSIGEYAAAVVAGVLTLDEASTLVAVRARETEDMVAGGSVGGMLSVVGDEDVLANWLHGRKNVWWAAENSFGQIVLSATDNALREIEEILPRMGFTCRRIPVSHPFHSALMAPVAARLDAAAAGLDARLPAVPLAANLTGTWLDSRYQPKTYWGEHLTSTVRWRDDVGMLLRWEPDILLEIGPGNVLTAFSAKILRHLGETGPLPIATMPDVRDPERDDEVAFLRVLGELWCRGVDLDFAALHDGERSIHRLLPTYGFERTSYWTNPAASIYVDPESPETAAEPERPDRPESLERPERLVRYAAKPDARIRLYCFPYAGGNPGAFRSWAQAAPWWLDVVAVAPHGHDLPDDPADEAVLADLARHIRSDAGSAAIAFCGLSFGASLALDLLGGPLSDWARQGRVTALVVVGRAPLAGGTDAVDDAVHDALDPESFLMTPDELRDDPAWQRSVLPALHADLAFDARSARRVAERGQLLDCPLQVHCGTNDPSFPAGSAPDWAAITASPVVDIRIHPGSHDFMLHEHDTILAQLAAFLGRLDPVDQGPGLREVRWVPTRPAAEAQDVHWTELGPDAARFLGDRLTGPQAHAALLCPLAADVSPGAHCATLLALLRSLVDAEARGTLIIVLPTHADSGLVTGMTRSLGHEEPGLTVQRVHVRDWPADRSAWVGPLLRAVRSYPDETDLLWRSGHLLAQRLLPVASPDLPPGTLGGVPGGYLVTGGTGGLGRIVVDWLIHHQRVTPERIIVSGRTDLGNHRRGIRFVPIDLTRPLDLPALAGRIGPLAGIFHLAGTLDDGVLRNLDASRFDAVLAPKLALAELAGLGAPWTVAFSSTSALLGAAGQANYAAANAWMDGYARWAAGGPAVVTIDWGTWGEAGMATRDARTLDLARAAGETPLSSGTALNLLGKVVAAVLSGASGRVFAGCDLDWSRTPWSGLPLIADLPPGQGHQIRQPAPRPAEDTMPHTVPDATQWDTARPDTAVPPAEADRVRAFLSAYVHRWDESKRLTELGLDSLDFVRIRGDFARAFGTEVPLARIARPEQRLDELHALLSGARPAEGGPNHAVD